MQLLARLSLLAVIAAVAPAAPAPDWKITTEPLKKILANYDTPMRVTVRDAAGEPVSGATVELVVRMIDMDHGEHKSAAAMTSPGVYEGRAKFFMVGSWTLETRVTKGKDSKTQTTRVEVKE